MLIVIVIIGILAGALLPKIMGVISRARDTKRITDLRNIAMAIQRYKMDNGEYPLRIVINPVTNKPFTTCRKYVGNLTDLQESLGGYILSLPKDPSKNNYIDVFCNDNGPFTHADVMKKRLRKGEYLYQLGRDRGEYMDGNKIPDFALLVAKVENPVNANYVILNSIPCGSSGGKWWYGNTDSDASPTLFKYGVNICSSIVKVEKGQEQPATADNSECAYSSEEQLYYIVKI